MSTLWQFAERKDYVE